MQKGIKNHINSNDDRTWLIAGLGNPGLSYQRTRHNIGFLVLDALANRYGCSFRAEKKWKSMAGQCQSPSGRRLYLLKPQTFMNLSGTAVQAAMAHYKLPIEALLVVHDEIDLPFGEIRFKEGGGHRGHNGLRDIKACLSSGEFLRLRFGVGRPQNEGMSVADYVLSSFSAEERGFLKSHIQKAIDMLEQGCGLA